MKYLYFLLLSISILGCQKNEVVDQIDYRSEYMGEYSIHFYKRTGDSLFIDSIKIIDTILNVHFMYNKDEYVHGTFFDTIPQRAVHMISPDSNIIPNQVFQMFENGRLKMDPGFTFPEYVGNGGFLLKDSISFYAESIGASKFFEQRMNGHKLN